MFNLKQLLENVVAEAINDPQETIPTDKLPSAIVIAERISQLEEALRESIRWHHGDKWRDGNIPERAAWEDRLNKMLKLVDNS